MQIRFIFNQLLMREILTAQIMIPKFKFSQYNTSEQHFLRIVEPILCDFYAKLYDEIDHNQYSFIDKKVLEAIYPELIGDRLIRLIAPSVLLELNLAKRLGELEGDTPQARFSYFFNQFDSTILYAQYPELKRLIITSLRQYNLFLLEIFDHYAADWHLLFPLNQTPPRITAIKTDMLDTYAKGRNVAILTFDKDVKWVYKPRKLAIDAALQNLLMWLNEQKLCTPFKTLDILCREQYSWSEYVQQTADLSLDDIEKAYEKLGALMCLLYLFEATDMHRKNIIIVGNTPILIDLETLMQPRFDKNSRHSLADTHILPEKETPVIPDADDVAYAQKHSASPLLFKDIDSAWSTVKILCYDDEGTADMRIVRRRLWRKKSDYRLIVAGKSINPKEYIRTMTKGFRKMYRHIAQHQASFFNALKIFKGLSIRIIVRDTEQYTFVNEEICKPAHVSKAENLMDLLSVFDNQKGISEQEQIIATEEKKELRNMNMPYFYTFTDKKGLFSSKKEIIPDYFDTDALSAIKVNISEMDEKNLAKQIRILKKHMKFM
jgi:type 2 lantibiotic biosynthesis protein LanM